MTRPRVVRLGSYSPRTADPGVGANPGATQFTRIPFGPHSEASARVSETTGLDAPTAVVFDLDGTLWLSGHPLPGAIEFVSMCRSAGAVVMAATNISMHRPSRFAMSFCSAGCCWKEKTL